LPRHKHKHLHTLPRHKHKHDACCQVEWSACLVSSGARRATASYRRRSTLLSGTTTNPLHTQRHTDADRRFFQVCQSTREYGKRGAGGGARVGGIEARVGELEGARLGRFSVNVSPASGCLCQCPPHVVSMSAACVLSPCLLHVSARGATRAPSACHISFPGSSLAGRCWWRALSLSRMLS
jgi:hypothetical protein